MQALATFPTVAEKEKSTLILAYPVAPGDVFLSADTFARCVASVRFPEALPRGPCFMNFTLPLLRAYCKKRRATGKPGEAGGQVSPRAPLSSRPAAIARRLNCPALACLLSDPCHPRLLPGSQLRKVPSGEKVRAVSVPSCYFLVPGAVSASCAAFSAGILGFLTTRVYHSTVGAIGTIGCRANTRSAFQARTFFRCQTVRTGGHVRSAVNESEEVQQNLIE